METAPRRRTRRESTRNRATLVEAADEVFASHGIHAPLDLVCRRAGLGSATLYRHFPTREALFLECLRLRLRRHDSALEAAQAEGSAAEALRRALTWLFAEEIRDRGLIDLLLAVEAGADQEVDALRALELRRLEEIVEAGKVEGTVREDRFLEDLLLFLGANARLAQRGGRGAAAASARLLTLALDSFATAPGSAEPQDLAGGAPTSVLEVRSAYTHRLAGTERHPDDL